MTLDPSSILALRTREARDATGTLFVEGVRFVVCALDAEAQVEGLVFAPRLLRSAVGQMLARRLRARGVPTLSTSPAEFAHLSASSDPQGIGVVVRQSWKPLADVPRTHDALWIAVESVRSPGNLGSILRTAEAVGATGLVALTRRPRAPPDVDPFDPGVVRATMGSLFAHAIARATWAELRAYATAARARIVGAEPRAGSDYRSVSYRGPLIFMLGSERRGMSPSQQAACDAGVRIPMKGRHLDSLNLAVAGSLLLYEAYRQRCPPLHAGVALRTLRSSVALDRAART